MTLSDVEFFNLSLQSGHGLEYGCVRNWRSAKLATGGRNI